jgi:two-component system chemotaxis response regulator CheY
MRALVIDDSPIQRIFIEYLLTKFQVAAHYSDNGTIGLRALQEEGEFDLIIVDWFMPGLNGLDFVKEVRANERFKKLPILMVTTENRMESMAEALEAGVNEYIMKPYTKEILAQKLELMGFNLAPALA